MENAFAAFQDLGYVSNVAGKMQLAASSAPESSEGKEDTVCSLEESLAKYLDREAPA
jgi:hypothetical protein